MIVNKNQLHHTYLLSYEANHKIISCTYFKVLKEKPLIYQGFPTDFFRKKSLFDYESAALPAVLHQLKEWLCRAICAIAPTDFLRIVPTDYPYFEPNNQLHQSLTKSILADISYFVKREFSKNLLPYILF